MKNPTDAATTPPPGDSRAPVAQDSRPPEQTESSTRHIFAVTEGEYRCSRCGSPMNDRTVNEVCPSAK
ncbi:MAG: hypothetical protein ABI592_10145 [Acidobacteriota bacterium]